MIGKHYTTYSNYYFYVVAFFCSFLKKHKVIVELKNSTYKLISRGFSTIDYLISDGFNFFPKTKKSNSISKFLRPWFEHRNIRGVIGASLISTLILIGFFGKPSSARSDFASADYSLPDRQENQEEIAVVEAPKKIVFATETRYQAPVETTGISQYYHRYHPGVDMRAPLGTEIKPIADGVVTQLFRSQYGYGQSLTIEHADGIASMYAHVMKITVEKGSNVDKNSTIASVGMTGQTTGPHLHLEIYKNGKTVNPQDYIGY